MLFQARRPAVARRPTVAGLKRKNARLTAQNQAQKVAIMMLLARQQAGRTNRTNRRPSRLAYRRR